MILLKIFSVLCFTAFVYTATVPPTTAAPTSVCQICKEMVAEARASLVSNLTVGEMKQVFEGTCKILVPIKSLANMCAKYADELVPELIDTLAQEMDPTRVCVASGLCQADSLKKVMVSVNKVSKALSLKVAEVLAKHDIGTIAKIAEAAEFSDERIENLLKGMCYLLPGRKNSGECADAVSLYYPVVKTVLFTTVKTNSDCQLCELVVKYVEEEFSSTAEKDLESLLLPICDHTGSYQGECQAFIAQYLPKLWSLILSEIQAKTLCTDIGLCTATATAVSETITAVPELKLVKSDECTICKDLIAEAKAELLSDEAISLAQAAVTQLCDICPGKKQCIAYMNANFAKLYKEFVGMIDPTITCTDIGACTSQNKLVHVSAEDPSVIVVSKLANKESYFQRKTLKKEVDSIKSGNVLECTACKYLVHYVQEELVKNESISHIETVLHKVCKKLPEVSSECDAFVDKYAAALAALVAQEVDPSYVCYKLIDVCSPQAEIVPKTEIKSISWNECSVCSLAVDYLSELLEKDEVDTDLTKIIEQVCKLMPKSSKSQCVSIISTYGPSIMNLVGELANSKQICESIKLCKAPKQALLGKEKCTYGPDYWCKDFATAKNCNAYDHCSKFYWSKAEVKQA